MTRIFRSSPLHSRVACGSQTFGGRAVLCASDASAMDRPRKWIDMNWSFDQFDPFSSRVFKMQNRKIIRNSRNSLIHRNRNALRWRSLVRAAKTTSSCSSCGSNMHWFRLCGSEFVFLFCSHCNDSDIETWHSLHSVHSLAILRQHCSHCIRSWALKLRGISLAADRRGHASHRAGSIDTHLQAPNDNHRVIEQLPRKELVAQMRREVKWTCYQESYEKLEIVKRMNQIEWLYFTYLFYIQDAVRTCWVWQCLI